MSKKNFRSVFINENLAYRCHLILYQSGKSSRSGFISANLLLGATFSRGIKKRWWFVGADALLASPTRLALLGGFRDPYPIAHAESPLTSQRTQEVLWKQLNTQGPRGICLSWKSYGTSLMNTEASPSQMVTPSSDLCLSLVL